MRRRRSTHAQRRAHLLAILPSVIAKPSTAVASIAADIFLDYANGNDTTGDGSSSAPYKTIAKALSAAQNGDLIGLRGDNSDPDSYYREYNWNWNVANCTLQADSGHRPVIAGSTQYTSWALTSGNVYETTFTSGTCWHVWNGLQSHTSVGSIAACEAAENSYYFDDAGDLLHVHILAGAQPTTIEAYDHANVNAATISASGVTLDGLEFRWHFQRLAVTGATCTIQNCTMQEWLNFSGGISFAVIGVSAADFTLTSCTLDAGDANVASPCLYVAANGAVIAQCTIRRGEYGIQFANSTGNTVDDCTFYYQDEDAVRVGSPGQVAVAIITNCKAYEYNHGGFVMQAAAGSHMTCIRCISQITDANRNGDNGFVIHGNEGGEGDLYHCAVVDGSIGNSFGRGFYPFSATGVTINIQNCIAYNCDEGFIRDTGSGTGTFNDENNCDYGCTTAYAGTWSQTGAIHTDPNFVDRPDLDLTLDSPSGCIDAAVAIAGVNDSYLGTGPDIGPVESA